jgi:hypothetical protein
MRRPSKRLLTYLVASALVAGWLTVECVRKKSQFDRIEIGMSANGVDEILGTPLRYGGARPLLNSTVPSETMPAWHGDEPAVYAKWGYFPLGIHVIFSSGKVQRKSLYLFPRWALD